MLGLDAAQADQYADIFDVSTHAEKIKQRKRMFARTFLREAVMYFVFTTVFCVTVNNGRSSQAFAIADRLRETFVTEPFKRMVNGQPRLLSYLNLTSSADFYAWTKEILVPSAFPVQDYADYPLPEWRKQYINQYNRRIGTVRLRQLRVRPNENCQITSLARSLIDDCWAAYDMSIERTEAFGPPQDPQRYKWQSSEELCGSQASDYCSASVFGKKGEGYSGNGYVIDLPVNQSAAMQNISQLQADRWIDFETRAVIIDLSVFNVQVRQFAALQLVVEFWPTGGLSMMHSVKPFGTFTLEHPFDIFIFALEVFLLVIVSTYFIREVLEFLRYWRVKREQCFKCRHQEMTRKGTKNWMKCPECQSRDIHPQFTPQCPSCQIEVNIDTHGCWRGYFEDGWNYIDIINQALFITVFSLRFKIRDDIQDLDFGAVGDGFLLLYPLGWRYIVSDWIYSVMSALIFAKLFKYLSKIRALATLVRTISNAKMELLYFIVIFFFLFSGFAFSFYLAFGTDLQGYSTWYGSMSYLFQIILGVFDYEALARSNRLLAPVYLIFYTLLVFFVLANVFIAIISAAHEEAIASLGEERDDFLSSALKLEINLWRVKLHQLFRKDNTNLNRLFDFIKNLMLCSSLSTAQLDTLRGFHKELEHDAYRASGTRMIAHVIHSLGPEIIDKDAAQLSSADYDLLSQTVRDWKDFVWLQKRQVVKHQAPGLWDSPDSEVFDAAIADRVLGHKITADKDAPQPQEDQPPAMGLTRGKSGLAKNHSFFGNSELGASAGKSFNDGGVQMGGGGDLSAVTDVGFLLRDVEKRQEGLINSLEQLNSEIDGDGDNGSNWYD
eukprot:NODE_118_length_2739_cov_24.345353_g94_i0.p1 GENE.NODE_118_length_2739_cov_24.345353_g94_i0~~NODE_118_length_2739_cov_24.345353_g94_i0.p1  ORF type:complete len:890 (+),score=261.86 NODE_118_length_2739_cov_24.345353_g94_i0:163-2670(+)